MRRQLVEELLDAQLLAVRVHVGYVEVIAQRGKVLMHLVARQTGRHPRVLVQSAARVVVRHDRGRFAHGCFHCWLLLRLGWRCLLLLRLLLLGVESGRGGAQRKHERARVAR